MEAFANRLQIHERLTAETANAIDRVLQPQGLEHTHTGKELTCVLKGTFSHQGGRYGPGDFDFGDEAVDHRPIVGAEEPCLCLVAKAIFICMVFSAGSSAHSFAFRSLSKYFNPNWPAE